LFHAIIHNNDADQTLIEAPVICMVGGLVLSKAVAMLSEFASSRFVLAGLVACLAAILSASQFFIRYPRFGKATGYYGSIHSTDLKTQSTFALLERLQKTNPVVVVSVDSMIPWRHIQYYFPNVPVVVLNGGLKLGDPPGGGFLMDAATDNSPRNNGNIITLPKRAFILWMLPLDRAETRVIKESLPRPWHRDGPNLYFESKPAMHFKTGVYQFRTTP
jgi:hypothetical protein